MTAKHDWSIALTPTLGFVSMSVFRYDPDPGNGKLGALYAVGKTSGGSGILHDPTGWHHWSGRDNPGGYQFFTNAVDELEAFANMTRWLEAIPNKEQVDG